MPKELSTAEKRVSQKQKLKEESREKRVYPLSSAQQRLWVLDQLISGDPSYNISVVAHLQGRCHTTVLQKSLEVIVQRHEVLRTIFTIVNGEPVQIIRPTSDVTLHLISLEDTHGPEREAFVQQVIHEESRTPFDLAKGPLLRSTLLQLDEEEHILLFTMHHIISDRWSLDVLIWELRAIYQALLAGQPSPLPPLPIQYTDFAVWQRESLQSSLMQKHLDYWMRRLGGELPILALPTDHPRPAQPSNEGAREAFRFSASLTQALKQLSQQEGTTLFMTLLASFQILLMRYSRQHDILIGVPIAGRSRREVEGLIGSFMNTVVVRGDLDGQPSFRELMQRVKREVVEAYEHQDVPFETLIEALQPQRALNRHPLFQVMFLLQSSESLRWEMNGLQMSYEEISNGTAMFDLTLGIQEKEVGLEGYFEYSTELFERETIKRMVGHWRRLVEEIVADPDQAITSLPLLTPAEWHEQVVIWNQTQQKYPQQAGIHQLFEAQAQQTPDRIAISYQSQQVSYQTLNEWANQLARRLKQRGVRTQDLVGICLERSVELVIALLAVFKTGAAYIPLDPAYPVERLRFMLEDSLPRVLLTQEHLTQQIPAQQITVLSLDQEWEQIIAQERADLPYEGSAGSLAYVMYTSGSTGRPKGVMVPHQNLVNVYYSWEHAYTLRETIAHHLQMASFSFDVFIADVLCALCSGGRLVLCPQDVILDAANLYRLMESEQIDCADMVPAVLRSLMRYMEETGQRLDFMRVLKVGSDSWSVQEYVQARSLCSEQIRLINAYGVTEATIDSTAYEARQETVAQSAALPIGRPIANTQAYILDEHQQPVPIGGVGELYLGGVGVAQGYLKRPDLTSERFVPDPFSQQPGARLYRTGDLARYLPDGNIVFLGRADQQVKVRGYRIELEEIEAVLQRHPKVRETVVVAREQATGEKWLVAYIVPVQELIPTSAELRGFLKERMPEYMVPTMFIALEALPLTPNGKIDRAALPVPEASMLAAQECYVAPRTEVEAKLAHIWEQLLGVERVSVEANFFSLGGHSLLAAQVIGRIQAMFQVELPLRSLFETPTVAALAESVEREQVMQGHHVHPIEPVPHVGHLPLSFAQQRLWFVYQWDAENPQYNTFTAVRLTGMLDEAVLERSLNAIIERHETLRTTFIEEHGQPRQVISQYQPAHLSVTRLTHLPDSQRNDQARQLAQREVSRPFNLTTGPLFRALLLQLSEQEHILVLNMHHIISDGWSLDILMRELTALYEAFLNGQPSPLPPLPIQYVDFAIWQRELLQDSRMQQHLDYWKRQLGGELPILALPTDYPRPDRLSSRGGEEAVRLTTSLTQALKQLSQQEGATLFMTLLASFQVLLMRYSGQQDILVGAPTAGRSRREVEGLIGFFVNTLVLRSDLSGQPGFRELLRRVKENTIAAYEHQDVPFEKLVEVLHPQRALNYHPLFQTMFLLQPSSPLSWKMGGVQMHHEEISNGTAKFDLSLELEEREGALEGRFEYNTDLFKAETIKRMVGHWQRLVEEIVADPDHAITRVPLLTQAEWQKVVVDWNRTQQDYPRHIGVHQLIEEQVQHAPDCIAIGYEDQQVSYQALNERANQLARLLKQRGVGSQELVGICLERSVEMVIALLAVFKAGGAYIPLDPAYPVDRLRFMLQDSHLRFLLTQHDLRSCLPLEQGMQVVCVDEEWTEISRQTRENLQEAAVPEQLAYVLYTSGSTGRPKGVQICQQSLVNFLCSMQQSPGIQSHDTLLAVTTLSFDIAGLELYLPLLVGARIFVMSREGTMQAEVLSQALAEQHGTIMQATPATWRLLITAGWQGKSDLRVLCGGEALPPDLAAWLLSHTNALYNMYGPTETTIWSTICPVRSSEQPITIGRPIANTSIYILDAHLQPVPIGVVGDLYIGGDGLARGYLYREELTRERFVPDPFSQQPGARLYRTGDMARYLPDGNIVFLGRSDHQVKVRGYRIELGEIEAVLHQHPVVRQAVVVAQQQAMADTRLIAYLVVSQQTAAPTQGQLRSFLKEHVPEYMVPTVFMVLDALPLTPNGKVDRAALPVPEGNMPGAEESYVAPRTEVEAQLTQIWEQLLNAERVSVEANFFDLGGHSLLATRLVSRIRETFRVKISLQDLFAAPTIVELARQVENALRLGDKMTLPQLLPVAEKTQVPLSFAQKPLWLHNQLEPESSAYNLPYAIRLKGIISLAALERSVQEIVYRHESLRTTFVVIDGQPLQRIQPAQGEFHHVEIPIVDTSDAEVTRLINEEAQRVFDLSTGPLLRAALFRLDPQEHVLLLTLPHIVFDAWSLEVLLRELSALYQAFSQGQPSPLSDLPVQYSDFTLWQQTWLQGTLLERQLSYWKQQLEGMPTFLELPTDRPRPATQTYQGASMPFTLPRYLCEAIQALGQQEGATLFMTLLAAYKILLAVYSGQKDVVVGAAIAGRNQRDVEDLIGCFINTLVLRTDLSGCSTFREVVRQVREVCLGAYAHPDVPFDILVEALQPKRNLSHNPLFQVSFSLANAAQQSITLPDITTQIVDVASETVQLDLQMWLTQTTEGISGIIDYSVDLFDASTIARMGKHFQTLLENVVARPDQSLSGLSLLTKEEREELLEQWNATSMPYAQEAGVHQLFEAQVAQHPDAIAVVYNHEQLTYEALNRLANQLAHLLRQQGVGPETLVGLALPRSLELIAGILAIFKAGGAYVPLDPHYPPQRLLFMLQQTQVSLLLTTSHILPQLPGLSPLPLHPLLLDRCWQQLQAQPQENLQTLGSSQQLAYVIYTSGSTGQPKGAMLAHQSVCNLWLAQRQSFGLAQTSRVLQFASLNFDASIFEILLAWGAGAALHLTAQETLQSGQALKEVLEREAITTLTIPPSALSALLPEAHLPLLQTLICAGEACPVELVERWAPARQMWNAYGPTETTVWATVKRCESIGQAPSIGKPISNVQLYLLDSALLPVPVGVIGELYIGGAGVARGYLKQAELTAQRFVPDAFSGQSGARLYKTGDVGKYLPTGEIEYAGRNDEQVKVRGYRIELGEITALLAQHPTVNRCVVMVREDTPGDKRLVAYIVPQEQSTFSPNELRAFLAARLPNYMVPTVYLSLDTLPLSPSGKVDLRALPAPEQGTGAQAREYVAPSTPVETLLAEIWSSVLKIERVGIHDNFFELGGDSILSIRIINKANEAGLRLLPRQMFQHQTIAALAVVATEGNVPSRLAAGSPSEVEQDIVTGDVPLTPIQHWFFEQQQPEPQHWNMTVLLEVRQKLRPALLEQAIRHVLRHHDALRLRFVQGAEGWHQFIASPDTTDEVPFIHTDLSMCPHQEQVVVMEAACDALQSSLNLADGPLMRVALFDLGPQQPDYLFITVHHLAVDIISWQILLEDLQAVYRQLEQGKAIQLMKKTTSFKQWVHLLQDYAAALSTGTLHGSQQELDYWRDNKRKQATRLPVDHEGAENTEAFVEEITTVLDVQETQALLQVLPRVYHSRINEVLLTALVLACKEWTSREHILVDLEGHGREEIGDGVDLSRTIGWFTTLTPVWLDVTETSGPGEALKAVKEQIRQIPHHGIGYGALRYLSPQQHIIESLKALPQAEISFNYMGRSLQEFEGDALWRLASLSAGTERSRRGKRHHLIEINSVVSEEKLHVYWTYSKALYERSTIEHLAREYRRALQALIQQSRTNQGEGLTPSDFSKARISQKDLDKILARVKHSGGKR